LVPFLKASADPWYLRHFSEEDKLRHASSRWDPVTRQAYSTEEEELDRFLDDDLELNFMDDSLPEGKKNPSVDFTVQAVAQMEKFPSIYEETDSVSTFHPVTPSPPSVAAGSASVKFNPKIVSLPDKQEDGSDSMSKLSDAESRISSLEYNFNKFQDSIKDICKQAKKEAQRNAKTLADILSLLQTDRLGGRYPINSSGPSVPSDQQVNLLDQMTIASGSSGTAGSGS
jgi:hypothetical protein